LAFNAVMLPTMFLFSGAWRRAPRPAPSERQAVAA
jgi:hypothetical protein